MNRPTLTFTTFTINVEVNLRIKFNVHEIKFGDGNHLKDGDEGPEGVANTALGDFWPCFDVKFFGNARISEFLRFQNLKTYVRFVVLWSGAGGSSTWRIQALPLLKKSVSAAPERPAGERKVAATVFSRKKIGKVGYFVTMWQIYR